MNQQTDIIIYCIQMFVMNVFDYYCFIRITYIEKVSLKRTIIILIANLILVGICAYIDFFVNSFLSGIILCIAYNSILGIVTKTKIGYSIIIGVISYAICMVCFGIGVILSFVPYKLLYNFMDVENKYINLVIILIIQFVLAYGFFKIKRFKNGFDFLRDKLNNDLTDIIVINISTIVILIYCLIGTIDEVTRNLFIAFIILTITMIVTIQRTLTMYYKQKLLKQTMEDYERELAEKDKEIERLKEEKFNISKITHEFYNRQKALEMSVKSNMSSDMVIEGNTNDVNNINADVANVNTEMAEEISALDRIENLTNEYSQKLKEIKSLPTLLLTEIPEIDDMFKYMQSECDKNKIEFKLKISGNMFYLINNIIPKNKLETMIGDHIRDSIIAINSSETTNREIFVILGIKDKKYELCIYDTGVEFEIDTLLKLGLEPITTHKDTGGSGIGFLTTFETLNETKASLIIKEESPSEGRHYTKSVTIRFDNKHQYKICSYRAEEIKKNNKDRKIVIEKT